MREYLWRHVGENGSSVLRRSHAAKLDRRKRRYDDASIVHTEIIRTTERVTSAITCLSQHLEILGSNPGRELTRQMTLAAETLSLHDPQIRIYITASVLRSLWPGNWEVQQGYSVPVLREVGTTRPLASLYQVNAPCNTNTLQPEIDQSLDLSGLDSKGEKLHAR
jgi:hypothetical protein